MIEKGHVRFNKKIKVISNPRKTFIVSKIPEESHLQSEIRHSFEDADKYLKVIPAMIVGRVLQGPRINEEMKVVPYSIVGPASSYEEALINKRNTYFKFSMKASSVMLPPVKKEEKVRKPNFESVDDKKIKSVYSEFENLKLLNQGKQNNFMKILPKEIKIGLKQQEKSLVIKEEEDKKLRNMSKYLAKLTKKKEEDLLIHRTNTYRIKKEVTDFIENKKSLDERYGVYNWNMSLRRPKNFKGTRFSYVNLGNDMNPLWLSVKETIPKSLEMVRNPHEITFKDYQSLKNNDYLVTTTSENKFNLKDLEKTKDIEVRK
jgi:hypothetical protein